MDHNSFKKWVLVVVLSLPLALVSCGKKDEPGAEEKLEVGAEFEPYVARFEIASKQYGNPVKVTNLVLKFGATASASERGACEIGGSAPPTIIVSESSWARISDSEREEFLFHELGHCVLHRKHLANLDHSGKPVSIMHPYSIDGLTYKNNQDGYLTELFQGHADF